MKLKCTSIQPFQYLPTQKGWTVQFNNHGLNEGGLVMMSLVTQNDECPYTVGNIYDVEIKLNETGGQ